MAKLNDTQLILLSTAAQRDGRNVWPLPDALADGADRAAKAITTLIKRGLVEERETSEQAHACRTDGDLRFGVYANDAGIAALDSGGVIDAQAAKLKVATAPKVSKTSAVLELLQREGGASLAELIAATGWLPHTTRAALTGLRKKGHAIERSKRGDDTCYRIVAAA